MVGRADEMHVASRLTGNGLHDAERQAEGVEHRALLDVDLEVADRRRRDDGVVEERGIETVVEDRVPHGSSAGIWAAEQRLVERADERPAADERHTVANAFFLGEPEDLDGERKPAAAQHVHERDAHHDAEHAVERARVRHRVEMRTYQKMPRSRGQSRVHPAKVPGRIDADRHADALHPAAQARVHVPHGGRQERARREPGLLGARRQRSAHVDHLASLCGQH